MGRLGHTQNLGGAYAATPGKAMFLLQGAGCLGESACHWRSWSIRLLARTRSTRLERTKAKTKLLQSDL